MTRPTDGPSGAEEVVWDLTDLYQDLDDPALDRDLDTADSRTAELGRRYRGKVGRIDPVELAALLEEYETIVDLGAKIGAYAYLEFSASTEDPKRGALLQKVTERGSRLEQELIFVEIEWAKAEDEHAAKVMESPAVSRWSHWLEVTRLYRPYLLSEAEEKVLSEKAVTGRAAWVRFFEEVHGASRYQLDGKGVPQQVILNRLHDADRERRREAAASFTRGLHETSRITTYVFNTILADKASEDRLRKYPTWITARNLSNQTDDETVEALVAAVTARYPTVARYYELKKKLLGLDRLLDYDRYAPLPDTDIRVDWEEARRIVLEAYGAFHPRMADIARQFFDRSWIHAAVRPGKSGGAYSHSASTSAHPYVFLNYEGRSRDVMTLAHELGHGVHQYLARERGPLQAHTPLTTAETASVFGEMLVFQSLLQTTRDRKARLGLLLGKIEDSFATVFRQVAMNRFEDSMHRERRAKGELTTKDFGEWWRKTQSAMFGSSLDLTEDYDLWWSYISHFIHSPGYVYAYAFGELLVLALYARYRVAPEGFAGGYLRMLGKGGSEWPHQLVEPLGVDLKEAGFWEKGLTLLDDLVGQAEALVREDQGV